MVTVDGDDVHVLAGLTDLVVLKTTGSEFWGFPRDRYTTLAETRDRILATAVTARWRYTGDRPGLRRRLRRRPDGAAGDVRRRRTPSPCSSRCTRWARRCSSGTPRSPRSGCRCRTSTTSCRTCRRSAWTTPDVVYHADDRPYGLIEGTVLRDDVPPRRGRLAGHPRLLLTRSAGLDADAAEQRRGVHPQVGVVLVVGALRPRRRRRCRRSPRNCHQTRQSDGTRTATPRHQRRAR